MANPQDAGAGHLRVLADDWVSYKRSCAPQHIWFGVSVEDGTKLSRVRHLQEARACTRFLSIEPLIGPVGKLDLTEIDWVIVGGESGPRARPMKASWVREIRDQCVDSDVAFFFKQWGASTQKLADASWMAKSGINTGPFAPFKFGDVQN